MKKNEVEIEHPDDRRARLRNEAEAAAAIEAFVQANASLFKALVLTYRDTDARWLLDDLREAFWSEL